MAAAVVGHPPVLAAASSWDSHIWTAVDLTVSILQAHGFKILFVVLASLYIYTEYWEAIKNRLAAKPRHEVDAAYAQQLEERRLAALAAREAAYQASLPQTVAANAPKPPQSGKPIKKEIDYVDFSGRDSLNPHFSSGDRRGYRPTPRPNPCASGS